MKKNARKTKSKKSAFSSNNTNGESAVAVSTKKGTREGEKNSKPLQKTRKDSKTPSKGGAGLVNTIALFLRQAKVELKKVKWPTRKELIASTVVVIVLTILVSFYLGLVDFGLIKLIKHVIG